VSLKRLLKGSLSKCSKLLAIVIAKELSIVTSNTTIFWLIKISMWHWLISDLASEAQKVGDWTCFAELPLLWVPKLFKNRPIMDRNPIFGPVGCFSFIYCTVDILSEVILILMIILGGSDAELYKNIARGNLNWPDSIYPILKDCF
jgi:hypothetical protein